MVAIISNVTSGVAASFTANDNNLTLSQVDYLISTNDDALYLNNGTYNLTIAGVIMGASGFLEAGIFVDDNAIAAITIGDTGVVRGSIAIELLGGAALTNNGSIIGTNSAAIRADAASDYEITNDGNIECLRGWGIQFFSTGNHSVVNSGVITVSADQAAIGTDIYSSGMETITNFGTINGDLDLGPGADSVTNSAAGIINGVTYLGTGKNRFFGGIFGETVYGGVDDDFIEGNGGADVLQGGLGRDTLNGGAGDDKMTGNGGSDLYIVDGQRDNIIETAGANSDVVEASVSFILGTNADIEFLQTASAIGKSAQNLTGNGVSQTITGNDGKNVLKGFGGSDTLIGRAGADTLMGGEGNDVLTGGKNKDAFVFNTAIIANKFDIITDFNHIDDGFRLENAFFKGLSSGKLDKDELQIIASPISNKNVDGDDFILYDKGNGDLYFDRDGADNQFDRFRFAQVDKNANVDHTDFFVI